MGDRRPVDGVAPFRADRRPASVVSLGAHGQTLDPAGNEDYSPHVGPGRVLPPGQGRHTELPRRVILFKSILTCKRTHESLTHPPWPIVMFQLTDHTNELSTDSVSVQVYVCGKMRAKIVSEVNVNVTLLQVKQQPLENGREFHLNCMLEFRTPSFD